MNIEPFPSAYWKRRFFLSAPMPPIDWTPESVAFHEAGHAVAASALGLPIWSAKVDGLTGGFAMLKSQEDGDSENIARPQPAEMAKVWNLAAKVLLPGGEEERILAFVTKMMAGTQSQIMHAGFAWPGVVRLNDPDTLEAECLLRMALGSCVSLGWCQLNARALLSRNWGQVEEISAALLTCGEWIPKNRETGG